jgi:hypothetical protein
MHRALHNKRIIGSGCKLAVKAHHSMIEVFDVDSIAQIFIKLLGDTASLGLCSLALPLEVLLGTGIEAAQDTM